jgi:hypothetical protein
LDHLSLRKIDHQLAPVKTAFEGADSTSACLEGTRVELLDSITRWMIDPTSEQVFWLTGIAGSGKTTVAHNIVNIASASNCLGATFFYSRHSERRWDNASVVPTLAYQLCRNPRLRSRILAVLDENKDINHSNIAVQAQKLIFDVLRTLRPNPPSCLLIILDALDECKNDVNRVHGDDLLSILISGLRDIPFVKVLLTSRPEPGVERIFTWKDLYDVTSTPALHCDIEDGIVRADIAHYLNQELTKLRPMIPNNLNFPSEADIQSLVARTGTLFIYARMVVAYISDPFGRPDHKLAALMKASPGQSNQEHSRLDELYTQILVDATGLPTLTTGTVDHDMRMTLIALVLAQQPLTANGLAVIAGVDMDTCHEHLQRLSAILEHGRKSDEPIRLMHQSFPDFLTDPLRCFALPGYVVEAASDHLRMLERCFEVMNRHLRYDICHLQDPSLSDAEVVDLQRRIYQHIPEFLQYACRFWAIHWLEHNRVAGPRSQVPQGLEEFCIEHLYHWVEVLSLTGNLDIVQRTMPSLLDSIHVRFPHEFEV